MKNIETYLIIGMVWLAMIQNEGKIEVLIFELFIYFGVKKLLKILSTDKTKNKKNTKAKYKYESFDEGLQRIADNAKALTTTKNEEIDSAIEEAKLKVAEVNERIKTYDFREFENRDDVTWEQVENYLWIHCKYKGYQMWTEYINHLVRIGKISKDDIDKIFSKHRKHISIMPRPDLEAKEQKELEEERWFWEKNERIDRQYERQEQNEHWNYKNEKDGTIHNIFKDLSSGHFKIKTEASDDHLSALYYDEYLKRKGYI